MHARHERKQLTHRWLAGRAGEESDGGALGWVQAHALRVAPVFARFTPNIQSASQTSNLQRKVNVGRLGHRSISNSDYIEARKNKKKRKELQNKTKKDIDSRKTILKSNKYRKLIQNGALLNLKES